jgi:capsular exopolysaccharide synthesis family protein
MEKAMQTQGSKPSIQRYWNVIWSRKWSSLGILLLVVLSAYYFTSRQTPEYSSTAEVLVKPLQSSTSGTTTAQNSPIFNLDTEVRVASSAEVADIAANTLKEKDALSLLGGLSVSVEPNTEILAFNYTNPSPDVAQQRAQAFAEAYLQNRGDQAKQGYQDASKAASGRIDAFAKKITSLQKKRDATNSSTEADSLTRQINSLETALAASQTQFLELSSNPPGDVGDLIQPAGHAGLAGPSYSKNVAVAIFLGLILAIALAFLRDRMDTRVTERKELEGLIGAPVLGAVPNISAWKRKKTPLLVSISQPDSPAAEAYRSIRTGLMFAASQREAKTILITSSQAAEGKTSTTANLGVVLAQAGKKVVIVGGDLRRTRLTEFFQPTNSNRGLAEVLGSGVPLEDALIATREQNLWLLPAGRVTDQPGELLSSDAMAGVITRLESKVDYILIDSAPILVAADALAMVPHIDGVLFVCDASKTTEAMVSDAREQMFNVHAPVLGALLNNYHPHFHGAYSVYRAYSDKQRKGRDARGTGDGAGRPQSAPDKPNETNDPTYSGARRS